jgi:hypothetical protein
MIIGGLVEIALGVRAERQSLEDIAAPLTAHAPDSDHPTSPAPAPRPEERVS